MLSRAFAQAMVDGQAALALGVWSPSLASLRRSPLQARLGFAFGALAAFYAARAVMGATGSLVLERVTLTVACALPLAALLLAEGVLRRHAPFALKLLTTAGAALTAVVLLAVGSTPPASTWGLGGFLLACLTATASLLVLRPPGALSRQEAAGADALLAAGLVLMALSVSDFMPAAPLGLSGVGTAMLAFVLAADPVGGPRRPWAELGMMVLASAALGALLAWRLDLGGASVTTRLAAVLLAFLLAVRGAAAFRRSRGATGQFAEALSRADTSSLDRYLASMSDQPLVGDLRLAEGAALADYAREALVAATASRPVWTRPGLASAAAASAAPLGFEQLADLMSRTDATHALLLSTEPARIGLLTLPDTSSSSVEAHLALFSRLAALAADAGRSPP